MATISVYPETTYLGPAVESFSAYLVKKQATRDSIVDTACALRRQYAEILKCKNLCRVGDGCAIAAQRLVMLNWEFDSLMKRLDKLFVELEEK